MADDFILAGRDRAFMGRVEAVARGFALIALGRGRGICPDALFFELDVWMNG